MGKINAGYYEKTIEHVSLAYDGKIKALQPALKLYLAKAAYVRSLGVPLGITKDCFSERVWLTHGHTRYGLSLNHTQRRKRWILRNW